MKLLGLLFGGGWMTWLFAGVATLAVLGGVYWYVYSQGYHAAETRYVIEMQQFKADLDRQRFLEIERQAAANATAKANEARRLMELQVENAALETRLAEADQGADADVDAGRIACNTECVRRYNRAIGGTP